MKIKRNFVTSLVFLIVLIFVSQSGLLSKFKCPKRVSYLINLVLKNKHYGDVKIAVRYRDEDGYWIARWFEIKKFGKEEVGKISCREIYLYGESADGKLKWEGNDDNYFSVEGSQEKYQFYKVIINDPTELGEPVKEIGTINFLIGSQSEQ